MSDKKSSKEQKDSKKAFSPATKTSTTQFLNNKMTKYLITFKIGNSFRTRIFEGSKDAQADVLLAITALFENVVRSSITDFTYEKMK